MAGRRRNCWRYAWSRGVVRLGRSALCAGWSNGWRSQTCVSRGRCGAWGYRAPRLRRLSTGGIPSVYVSPGGVAPIYEPPRRCNYRSPSRQCASGSSGRRGDIPKNGGGLCTRTDAPEKMACAGGGPEVTLSERDGGASGAIREE